MKAVLLISVFLAFVAIGYFIYKGYRTRKQYFESFLNFSGHLITEINFSKAVLPEIIDNYAEGYSKEFTETLRGYKDKIEGRADITREALAEVLWNGLKPNEARCLTDFFLELGRHSSAEEVTKIANKKNEVSVFYNDSAERLRKEASIYLKICILVGVGAAILLI